MTLRWIGPITAGLLAAGTLGCTDSPPPPAKGASTFVLTTGGCNFTGGFHIPEVGVHTTRKTPGQRAEDGKSNAKIRCTVSKQGQNQYSIGGSILQGTRGLSVVNGLVGPDAEIDGYSGSAQIIHTDTQTGTLESDAGACQLTVYENQDVAAGRVWGNFSCVGQNEDGVRSNNNPSARCNAEGNFILENCDK